MHKSRRCSGFCWINIHVYIKTATTPEIWLHCRTHNLPQNSAGMMKTAKCMNTWGGLKQRYLFQIVCHSFFKLHNVFWMGLLLFPEVTELTQHIDDPVAQVRKYEKSCYWNSPLLCEFILRPQTHPATLTKVSPWQRVVFYEAVEERKWISINAMWTKLPQTKADLEPCTWAQRLCTSSHSSVCVCVARVSLCVACVVNTQNVWK